MSTEALPELPAPEVKSYQTDSVMRTIPTYTYSEGQMLDYARAALAAASAGGAEPVVEPMDDDELQDFCISLSFDQDDYTTEVIRAVEDRMRGVPLFVPAAAPTEPTVLFDDRLQNQRIAEAEERMRNPAPLQWEEQPDESVNEVDPADTQPKHYVSIDRPGSAPLLVEVAQSERLPYVSALDPVMQAINAKPEALSWQIRARARRAFEDYVRSQWTAGYGCPRTGDGYTDPNVDFAWRAVVALTARPEAPAEPSESVDIGALQEQSEAWYAVVDVLEEVSPKWRQRGQNLTGIQLAVQAIRALAAPAAQQPAELTDAEIDTAAANETGFDVADPDSLQAMSLEEIRRIVRSAIKAQGGIQ